MGVALGVALGSALAWPLVHYGIDVTSVVGGEGASTGGVAMDFVIRGGWDFARVAKYSAGAIVFTLLAAAWPAWRVTRLEPVEAMRAH
jgi:ABC-type lipoprotein release transport system permease subunit